MGRLEKLKRQVIAEANKRVLNEELDKSLKDVVITGLQLKQAGYRKEDNRVVIYFDKNDLKEDIYFLNEFVLWGLVQFKKLSKVEYSEGIEIKDPYGDYIKNI